MKNKPLLILLCVGIGLLGIGLYTWFRSSEKPKIVERGRTSTTVQAGKDKEGRELYKTTFSIKPIHYQDSNGSWHEYDTTLVATNKNNSDYALRASDHQAYFAKNITESTITVEKEDSLLSMNPGTLQYINDKGQTQVIAQPNRNANSKTKDNTITYKDVYGRGIDLRFTTTTTHVMKELIINSKDNLPKPTIANPKLELSMKVMPPKDAKLFVTDPTNPLGGKVDWISSCPTDTCETEIIANAEFRDTNTDKKDRNYDNSVNELDSILYSFIPAVARDSSKNPNILSSTITGDTTVQRLSFALSKAGNDITAKVATPYSWLEKAQYPVSIDPTVSLAAESNDGYLINHSTTYATAQAGGGTFVTDSTSTTAYIGQAAGAPGTTYYLYQSFLSINTRSLENSVITDASLKIYGDTNDTAQDFTINAALYDNGGSVDTGDWQDTAELQALTEFATFNTTGFSTSGYNTFSNVGSTLINGISKTGDTRIILWSDRLENSNAPVVGTNEYVWFQSQQGTNDPVLEVTYHKEPDQMQFYFQMEDADANQTYNSMTIGRPWDNSNKLVGTDTAVAFSAAPCENAANDGHTRVPVDTDAVALGEKCAATFFSPPVGKAMTISTDHSNALQVKDLDAVITSSDSNAAATASVRFYKYDGSSYTIFGTLTSGALALTTTTLDLTGTPSATVSFSPNDRIVAVVTTTITTADTTSGTDRIIFDFAKRSQPARIVVKYNTISTPNKPELSGPKDDDFNEIQAQQDCNAGLTYNTKWTCLEATDDGNLLAGVTSSVGTTGWLTITDTENATLNSSFAEGATYMYQTIDTNDDGDGSITTAMNAGTVDHDTGTSPYFSSGLLLWTSDSDYLILQIYYDGTNKSIAINDDGTLSNSSTVSLYNRVYLRWTKDGNNYQASYSTDGLTFTNVGSPVSHATTFTRTGLMVHAAQSGEHYSVAYDWFDYTLGGDNQDAAMLGHWKFDEGTGTTANNSGILRNTINGTISGATWSASGKSKNALDFDNSDDSVSLGANSQLEFGSDQSFSISAWVKPDTNDGFIFFYGDTDDQWYALQYENSGLFTFDVDDDVTKSSATTASSYSTGSWYHVVGVRDRPNDELRIYVNGQLADTTTDDTGSVNNSTQRTTYIGRKTATGAGGQYYDGLIDEVKLYNTALSNSEVAIDYNAGKSLQLGVLGTDASGNPSNSTDRAFCPPGDTTATCGPIAYFPFEEKSGVSTADKTANGNTGTLTNGPSWINGKIGGALSFDGSNDVVDIGSAAILDDLSALTFSSWIYVRSDGEVTQRVFNKTDNATAGWGIAIKDSSDEINFYVRYDGGTNLDCDGTTPVPISSPNSSWTHVTVTWDGTSTCSGVKIYINGKSSGIDTNNSGTGNRPSDASFNARLGNGNSTSNSYDGNLDEVKIYNYVRSASQVAWDYSNGKPIAHWKFDECSGSTAYDSSGNQLNGTLNVGASGTTSIGDCTNSATTMRYNGRIGKRNYGLAFDNTDDYINIPYNSTLGIRNDITITAWVKRNGSNQYDPIVAKTDGSVWDFDFVICDSTICTSGSQNLLMLYSDDTAPGSAVSTETITDTNWHHVAVTRNGSNVTFYIDGKNAGTDDLTGPFDNTSVPIRIGTDGPSYNAASVFNGDIDDVRLYNYALTAQQVKTVMNDGAVRWGPATGAP